MSKSPYYNVINEVTQSIVDDVDAFVESYNYAVDIIVNSYMVFYSDLILQNFWIVQHKNKLEISGMASMVHLYAVTL